MNNLAEWLSYLETLHPKTIDLGLERIKTVAARLDCLSYSCPVITVAGTNGKGSCVTLTETILLAAGYRVGSYLSPHLFSYNERVRINGKAIDDKSLCDAFVLIDKARGDISLSYFEFGTLATLLIFKKANLDAIILEVGLGGRLDAVNIVDADLAIISTIALDHMEWLGDDREKIGFEKAGIMRSGKACVCGDFEVPDSVRRHADTVGATLYCQNEEFGYERNENVWSWWSKKQRLDNLPIPSIELQNAATALMAIELLQNKFRISFQSIEQGLKQVFLPGRFQTIHANNKLIILDVAHNPAAAKLLAKKLNETFCSGKTIAVMGMLADKDILGTMANLLDNIAEWYVGGLFVPRGASADCLAKGLSDLGVKKVYVYETVTEAYQAALTQVSAQDRMIVFGSFYTVAEVLHNYATFTGGDNFGN